MVHNARLEAHFLAKKAEFERAGKPTSERIGFHGTSAANARGIVEQGLSFWCTLKLDILQIFLVSFRRLHSAKVLNNCWRCVQIQDSMVSVILS